MRQSGLVTAVALVGMLLVVGTALCAFDEDGTVNDLCLMSLALLGSMLVLSPLPVAEHLERRPLASYPSLFLDLPSPPPKV